MRGLDDTDEEILGLLLDDARKPYSEIAAAVGLSAPAVSDRIDRLEAIGILDGFTVELNRERLAEGESYLLSIEAAVGQGEAVATALEAHESTESVFRTVDDTVVCTLVGTRTDVESLVGAVPTTAIEQYEVQVLTEQSTRPAVGQRTFAPDCVECGNTVTSEGEREQFDGELYYFCCDSCLASFREQYERLDEGV